MNSKRKSGSLKGRSVIKRGLLLYLGMVSCLASSFGCVGYQIGADSMFRPDIHTVYVPPFESNTFRRNLGERLTEAVVKEIEATTPYKVVDSSRADSVLQGRILAETKRVIVENTNDEAREIETNLQVQINWVNRRGDPLIQRSALPLPTVLVDISQSSTLVPEAGQSIATAHQETISRLAKQIVAQMELGF